MNIEHSKKFLALIQESTDLMTVLRHDLVAYTAMELQQELINLTGKNVRPKLSCDELQQFIDHLKKLIKVSSQKDKLGKPLKLGKKYEFFKKFYILQDVNGNMATIHHAFSSKVQNVPCNLLKPYNDLGVPF